MNDFTIPEMSDEAKRAWGAEIERLIRATGMTQDQLAGEIDENRRSTLVAEISRFKKGDDRTLARWFGQKGEHDDLDSFVRLLDTTAEHLHGVLQRVVRGGTTESGWHTAFPMVELDAVFISPKVRTELAAAVKTLAERVQATGQMGTCWLVGPAGSGRRTTARILVRDVREIIREKASEGASEDASAFAWRIVDEEGKVLAFEGAARPSLEFRLRCVENLRRDEVEAAASSRPDVRLDMDSWGASEMGQLIERLAQVNAVRRSQRERLSQFARVALTERYLLGPLRWPADVIHLMSIVAGGKVPKDGAETREMLIERAWRLAIERSGGKTLELLDDRFFERFCGHHVLGADVGRWLEMTEGQALAALDATLGDRPRGSAWQSSILQLIDEVATAPNKKKTAAVLSELRRGVATRESAIVLEQLIAGELLRRGEGDRLTFSDTPLAQTAAMRGCHLLGLDPFHGRWEALLTRDADLWIVEYALAGACPPSFMAALADVPDWAAFDACAARVVFAAASPVDLSARFVAEHVTPSWITLLHTRWDAVEWCDHHDPRPETHKRIDEALRMVSERCRRDLPQIDSADTFESLASRIPSPARQFMKGWQSLFTRPDWLPGLGSLSLGLRRGLWDLAPWQLVWWHVNDRLGDLRPEHIQLIAGELVRLAEEGNERARRVLADPTSAPWSNQEKEVVLAFRDLEEPMRNGWCRLPLDVRLRWIGRADPDVEIWGFALLTLDERLRQEDEDEDAALDDAMNVLDRFDPEVVEAYLAAPFRHRGDRLRWPLPPARLALKLAERRRLLGVLREVAALRLTFLEGVSFGVSNWQVVVLSSLSPPCLPKVDTFIPILTELEELAHTAAVSLLALEEVAPLEARWRCRAPSELESRVFASLQRAEKLASGWNKLIHLDVDSAPYEEIEPFLQDAQARAFPEELVPVAGMRGRNDDKSVQRYMWSLRNTNYAFDRTVMQWTVGEMMQ